MNCPPTPLTWEACPPKPLAKTDEMHVWRASLDVDREVRERFNATLSRAEIDRARRFHFGKDRNRFIVRRGVLRAILGQYLEIPPETVAFRYTPHGKPELDLDAARHPSAVDLRFNLSFSRELTLVAVTRRRAIGIDVECIDPERADRRVAKEFFSEAEAAKLDNLTGRDWERGFFNCWTRKEAYVKAIGEGLSIPLQSFEVSLTPDEPPALLKVRNQPERIDRWTLIALDVESPFIAALVAEGQSWSVRCFRYQP